MYMQAKFEVTRATENSQDASIDLRNKYASRVKCERRWPRQTYTYDASTYHDASTYKQHDPLGSPRDLT